MKTTFIFIPTWRCNLAKCSYCDYSTKKNGNGYELTAFDKKINVGPEIQWPVWLYLLERFRPYHLDLTGGEPLCYKELPEFMAHLPVCSTWAITSNSLMGDLRKFETMNCDAWTASYHYHSDEKFFKNLEILAEGAFGPRATLVLSPDNIETVKNAIERVTGLGVGVNIHPVLKQGFDWGKYPEIWDEFKAMDDGKRILFISDIPTSFADLKWPRAQACGAGMDYFVLFPDGMVYRCYTMILKGKPLGHIKDLVPSSEPKPCEIRCRFPCDIQVPKHEDCHNRA